ncbi:RNA-dependent RNA polymerase [Ophiocordyceps sinensis mitovirus 2]|nr:RNA-dependent RNA polymerase [Ophiocordyceps sinensis mitovirus 2]
MAVNYIITMKNNKLLLKKLKVRFQKDLIFDFTSKVVKWLSLNLKQDQPSIPVTDLIALCERYTKLSKDRGILFAMKHCKATRNNLYNYLSGNPIRDITSRCDKGTGLPIILGSCAKQLEKDSYRNIAMILTVLSCTRALKFKTEPDVSSITQPVKGDVPDLTKHMLMFWKEIGYRWSPRVPRKFLKANLKTYRVSKGPNGHALTTALLDVQGITPALLRSITVLSPMVGNAIEIMKAELPLFIEFYSKHVKHIELKENPSIRRLACFPDKEGKTRVIGILDYYSQISLKPMHTWLSRVLQKIPQDCTLDQLKYKKGLLDSGQDSYHSIDLSNATDRFPMSLISDLLTYQLPADYVKAWEQTMIGEPFDHKTPEGNVKLHYGAGNPMGAYGSFNSFALTHHYLIYYCCRELGLNWKRLPYALLGDDIVIRNDKVGEMYKLIIKSLHVEYSAAKTHTSKHFYEFAKRIHYKGQEITPFPVSALKECGKSHGFLTLLMVETESKGWLMESVSSSVSSYMGVVKGLPSRVRKQVENKSWLFENVLRVIHGVLPAATFLAEYCRRKDYPFESDEEESKYIFSLLLSGIFRDSAEKIIDPDDGMKIPLDERIKLLILLWDKTIEQKKRGILNRIEMGSLSLDLTKTPMYQASLAVMKLYEDLEDKYNDQSQYLSNWTYMMKSITVPVSDKSLIESNSFRQIRTVNAFVAELERYMEEYIVPY